MKLRPVKISYAYKNGRLIHVSQVESGKNCGCTYDPEGKQPVVAKKGAERREHFSFLAAIDPIVACESLYHALAKQLIHETKKLRLPHLHLEFCEGRYFWPIRPSRTVDNFEVENESRISGGPYVADSILEFRHKGKKLPLVVEWVVTHSCEPEKLAAFNRNQVPSVEIYLGNGMDLMAPEAVANWILYDAPRRWIWHPAMAWDWIQNQGLRITRRPAYAAVRFYKTRQGVKGVDALWVKDCPITKSVVSTARCSFCPYAYYVEYYQGGYVDCAGESADSIKAAMKPSSGDLADLKEAVFDGGDWYERATPNLGNGFRRDWDKPRSDLVLQVRLEMNNGPYAERPHIDFGCALESDEDDDASSESVEDDVK